MSSKKIQNIQALRGIAVLLVAFSHMLPIEKKYAQFDYILPDFFLIGVSGVDLFFLISGFVMVAVTRDIFQSKNKITRFLYHRVTRIYPLYWFYSSILLCVYIVQPTLINNSQGNQVNIISSFLLIPQDLLPLVNVGWSLIYEIYFYIIFSLILLLPEKKLIYSLLAWAVIIIVGSNTYLWETNSFTHVYLHPLTLEFIIGCFIAKLYFSNKVRGNAHVIALFAITSWIGGYLLYQHLSNSASPHNLIRVLVFGVPAALGLYSALLYENKHNIIMPEWIRNIGDSSYSIYLSHVIVLSIVGRIWRVVATEGYFDNIIALIIMTISVLTAGFISYKYIEKYFLAKTRTLEKVIFN